MRTGQEGRRPAPGTPGAGCSRSARRTPARGATSGQNRPRSRCPGPCAPCTGAAAAQVRGAIRSPVCGGRSVLPVVTIGGPPPLRGTIRMPAGIGIASPIRGRRVHPRQALGRGGHLPPPPCPEPPSGRAGRIRRRGPDLFGPTVPVFSMERRLRPGAQGAVNADSCLLLLRCASLRAAGACQPPYCSTRPSQIRSNMWLTSLLRDAPLALICGIIVSLSLDTTHMSYDEPSV